MTIEEELMLENEVKNKFDYYLSKINDKYNRANTISKKKKLAIDLLLFEDTYNTVVSSEKTFLWQKDSQMLDLIDKVNYEILITFLDNINSNSESYSDIINSVIDKYKKVEYPLYQNNQFLNKQPKLNRDKMLDVVYSFLSSYDNKCYLQFKNQINDYDIYGAELYTCTGVTTFINSLNKKFILFHNAYTDTLYMYKVLMHEFGHCYEFNFNDDNLNKCLSTPFYEVSSTFFEYSFLNYLKEQRIFDNKELSQCYDEYYNEIFCYGVDANLSLKTGIDGMEMDENSSFILEEDNIVDYVENIKEEFNYYLLPSSGGMINIKDSFIYFIGQLFSIYLYDNYKNNPKEFKKNFENALFTYPNISDISAFNSLGINEEVLIKGSTLERVLNEFVNSQNNFQKANTKMLKKK